MWDYRRAVLTRCNEKPIMLGESTMGHAVRAYAILPPATVTRGGNVPTTTAIAVAVCRHWSRHVCTGQPSESPNTLTRLQLTEGVQCSSKGLALALQK